MLDSCLRRNDRDGMSTVAAIILAAGQGQRMGQPKLFLEIGGRTFLETAIATLEAAGLADIVVVTRADCAKRAAQLAGTHRVVVNPDPERGMLSSLAVAVRELPDADGYLVLPVDHPRVGAAAIASLLQAFSAGRGTVVKPIHDGRAGHPVIIPRRLARDLPSGDVGGGLAKVIADSGVPVELVTVDDPGILKNVNEPHDLETWTADNADISGQTCNDG